jgi:hypothetical protein
MPWPSENDIRATESETPKHEHGFFWNPVYGPDLTVTAMSANMTAVCHLRLKVVQQISKRLWEWSMVLMESIVLSTFGRST